MISFVENVLPTLTLSKVTIPVSTLVLDRKVRNVSLPKLFRDPTSAVVLAATSTRAPAPSSGKLTLQLSLETVI